MPNLEWDVAHTLTSPLGSVDFNTIDPTTGYCYLIREEDYKIVPAVRITEDNISQQDGSVLHPRWITGQQATVSVRYLIYPDKVGPDYLPACGSDLRIMHEALMVHIQALLRPVVGFDPNAQRLTWTPTGLGDTRFLYGIQTKGWAEPSREGSNPPETIVEFVMDSPYPYAIDATPDPQTLTAGPPVLVPNPGSAPYFPVWEVQGATSAFTITNNDTSTSIVYSGVAIPGGSDLEIDTFNGTAYVNGSGADRIAGIDPILSDFFPIQPGGTNIVVAGATVLLDAHGAYA